MPNQEMYATHVEGVFLKPLQCIEDERGAVMHWLRADSSLFSSFGEVYFSRTNPGIVKAWKFHERARQNLVVPSGVIVLAIFDPRENSASRSEIATFRLGEGFYQLLQIPPGVWYGWKCVSETSALIGNLTDFAHDPSNANGESQILSPDTSKIAFDWASIL